MRNLEEDKLRNAAGGGAINHEQYLTDMLEAVISDVMQGAHRAPNKAEIASIEQAFHDNTDDHYVKITVVPGGLQTEISNKPLRKPATKRPVPGRTPAHDAARIRGDAAREKVNKSPVNKAVPKKTPKKG